MTYIFPPQRQSSLPIIGSSQLFPVFRIFCIGQNYRAHAIEMGQNPNVHPDFFFFSKPITSLVSHPSQVDFPKGTKELHHEVELVIALGGGGKDLNIHDASNCIFAYGIGVDLTKRDIQKEVKTKGRPWDPAKGFDQSAPISSLSLKEDCGPLERGSITLRINDHLRQEGSLEDMITSPNQIICKLSQVVELFPGDLIFTGTPKGVGPLIPGDDVQCQIEGLQDFCFRVI